MSKVAWGISIFVLAWALSACDVRAPRERPASDLNPPYPFPKEEFTKVIFRSEELLGAKGVTLLPAHVADLEVALHWQAETCRSLEGKYVADACSDPSALSESYMFVGEGERLIGKISRFEGCPYLWLWPDETWLRLNEAGTYRLGKIALEVNRSKAYREQ